MNAWLANTGYTRKPSPTQCAGGRDNMFCTVRNFFDAFVGDDIVVVAAQVLSTKELLVPVSRTSGDDDDDDDDKYVDISLCWVVDCCDTTVLLDCAVGIAKATVVRRTEATSRANEIKTLWTIKWKINFRDDDDTRIRDNDIVCIR